MQSRTEFIRDVTVLAAFLVWLEHDQPNATWGARKVRDAVNALASIMGVDPTVLRERMLLDEPQPGDDRHA